MDAQRLEEIRVSTREKRDFARQAAVAAPIAHAADDYSRTAAYFDDVLELVHDHRPPEAIADGTGDVELLLSGLDVGSISDLRRLVELGRARDL